MKVWHKFIVVFLAGGTVWGLSYLSSVKPDMAMMLASVNAAVVAISSYVTGYPVATEA